MLIVVGTKNKSKLNAVSKVANDFFYNNAEVVGFKALSKVRDMPFSDEEAIEGAKNRALHCINENNCDIAIGIEGSVRDTSFGLFMTCWVFVIESSGIESLGAGAHIRLPDIIREPIMNGIELGRIFESLPPEFEYDKKNGPMGFLTKGTFTRENAIETAVRMAISPLIRKEVYSLQSWHIVGQ